MKVVILHLDGLGFNYLLKFDLPFIRSLGGYLYRMKIYPGYFVNEVSLFTGLEDKHHKMEDIFILDPSRSLFNNNPLVKFIPPSMFRLMSYLKGQKTFITIKPPFKHYFQIFAPVTSAHPYKFENSFTSILQKSGLRFCYLNSFRSNTISIKKAIQKNDCVYAMDSEYDKFLHYHGPDTKIKKDTDGIVKEIHNFLKERYSNNFCLILLSDHGMVKVKDIISIEFSDDDIYFVDSTILRIWNNKENFHLGVDTADLIDYQELPGKYRYYRKYVAKEGYIFSPNFFQGKKFINGMHGYNSQRKDSDNDAFMIVHNPRFKRQYKAYCSIIDLAPTVLSAFKIKPFPVMDGRSLYDK